ncbi:neuropeptide Y receptor type 6-like [Actinia tenebrosa]|uniref:Neuropeptide Y receptor type 6-like n=1 Tax=Actinia tenebrosa TaxID=6105 RepID=A0A6P8IE17_ACTTE|nr:neuropeptide Y receptor type 6-like [Actinia tenebrosa]XP_031563935.1 neuropeptide Y receptor type 6-like [Actinia tenebrosa]
MNNTTEFMPPSVISKAEILLTLVVYILTFVLGVVGNILVFLVIFTKRERRTSNDIFLVNLAAADLLTVSVSIPIKLLQLIAPFIHVNCFVCKILYPMMTVPYCASIFTITSMSIQRRSAILNPWKGIITQRTTSIWCGIIWVIAALLILPVSIISTVKNGMCFLNWSKKEEAIYIISIFFIQYILPLIVILLAYVQICLNLKKYQKNIVRQEIKKENIEITRTIAVIVIIFAVVTLPLQVFWMLYVFHLESIGIMNLVKLHHYAELLTDVHSCMNPLVYGALTRRFRHKYTLLLSSVFKIFDRPQRESRSYNETSRSRRDETMRLKQRSGTV